MKIIKRIPFTFHKSYVLERILWRCLQSSNGYRHNDETTQRLLGNCLYTFPNRCREIEHSVRYPPSRGKVIYPIRIQIRHGELDRGRMKTLNAAVIKTDIPNVLDLSICVIFKPSRSLQRRETILEFVKKTC